MVKRYWNWLKEKFMDFRHFHKPKLKPCISAYVVNTFREALFAEKGVSIGRSCESFLQVYSVHVNCIP